MPLLGERRRQVDITGMPIDRVARLGMVKTNQIIRDFDGLTIRDSLLLSLAGAALRAVLPMAARHACAGRRMRRSTGTSTTSTSRTRTGYALSAGEKKLLDIIRCLLVKPRLLLMDEPTAGLPDDQTRRVMDLMKQKAAEEDIAIVIVEHDLGLIWEVCEFVHFMADGEIRGAGDAGRDPRQQDRRREVPGVERCLRCPATAMLEARGLTSGYGGVTVLKGLDFAIRPRDLRRPGRQWGRQVHADEDDREDPHARPGHDVVPR